MADIDSLFGHSLSSYFLIELTTRITEVLSEDSAPTLTSDVTATPIGIKSGGSNYVFRSQLLRCISQANTNRDIYKW